MAPHDPHRERAFHAALSDIKTSHDVRDGRYKNQAAQLHSLGRLIRDNDLKLRPWGKPVLTPNAKQLRAYIVAAFGGVKIFTAPLHVLDAEQKEQYWETAPSGSQTPRKVTPSEAKEQEDREPPPQVTRHRSSGVEAAEQSDLPLDTSPTDADISHPDEVKRKIPTRIRLRVGTRTRPATAPSTVDHGESREIADSQSDNVPSDEGDSCGTEKAPEVIDLSQMSSPQQGKDKYPENPKPGNKRKAEIALEVETHRSTKKRALIEDGQRPTADEDLNALVCGTKRTADTTLDEAEGRISKKRTPLGEQTKLATDMEFGPIGRRTKRKAGAAHDDDERVSNKRKVAKLDNGSQSGRTSLVTENDDSYVLSPNEKQDANQRATQQVGSQPQPASQRIAKVAGDEFPADEDRGPGETAGSQSGSAQASTATQKFTPDETTRRARLGLGRDYPFGLRSIEDVELQVASMVSTMRTVASIVNESIGLADAPRSLMRDPDQSTGRLYRRMFAADDASWSDNANRFLSEGENTAEVLFCGLVGAALFDRVWSKPVPWQTAQDLESGWSDALEIAHRLQSSAENKWPLEYFIYQISADRLKDGGIFDAKRIQPLAREHAESMLMALMPQCMHMNPKLRIQESVRAGLLESLTFLFANALKLRGRLEADPANYEYLWPHSGMKFERWMRELGSPCLAAPARTAPHAATAPHAPSPTMKFGKHIQKRQLDIPEYAGSFVDYKSLKKLIKKLSATPVLAALHQGPNGEALQDSQASLQANKATFFFRLERELEKVNTFYLQKEAELKLRLRTLLDKKRGVQHRATPASKLSSSYVTLDEGFRLFSNDLDKLQQFVEVNQTAFSKILKKWDKTSKSRTKELYLSRAVDVQPCFNRDVISDLSDQATTGLLELQAWAEGEKIAYTPAVELEHRVQPSAQDEEVDNQVLQAINAGNVGLVREWSSRVAASPEAAERISRIFLTTVSLAAPAAQEVLYATGLVDFNFADSINERNCIHEAAVCGKSDVLRAALANDANIRAPDVYGRLPLHYACMHGRVDMVEALVAAAPDTVDSRDLDHFTPLIHGIVHSQLGSVQEMLQVGAIVNQTSSTSHIPLNLACQYGSAQIVQQILRFRPEILPDAEGLYPQHLVARFGGDTHILQMLRDYGVDMDQPDKLYQWTPIFHAASEGHVECLRQLLDFHVDPAALDEKDLNAMYYAAWEGKLDCMQLLAKAGAAAGQGSARDPMDLQPVSGDPPPLTIAATPTQAHPDAENIPSLELPPPIIPLRRYGHNFLDTTKTFIQLSFGEKEGDAIEFYGDSKYPAARLTISSKSSDLIPRNLPLPIQDEMKNLAFQIEDLDNFSIDFDIFPTFGSKVIARAAASSRVFTGKASSSGDWHLELFDPRLRAIGRISFHYQVVTPFHGIPLEITHFATYWKATSQFENHPSNLITGSSLSGDFLRLFVQITSDGVPVLYNDWSLPSSRNDLISRLTYQEFRDQALQAGLGKGVIKDLVSSGIDRENLAAAQQIIAQSRCSLESLLAILPADLHLEIHICYPTRAEEEALRLGPTQNINVVVDGVLKIVFDHARHLRELNDSPQRSFVFSSYNPDICIALNWKQPNYPVLLCNELGVAPEINGETVPNSNMVTNCGRRDMSIKESVRIAQSNNFMGLICTSRLLDLVPALVSSVKEAGLVLMSDYSNDRTRTHQPSMLSLPKGADGLLLKNAVLRFKDQIDQ
ncbi:hypothetical protein BST61_g3778 [Cercospora zeina]